MVIPSVLSPRLPAFRPIFHDVVSLFFFISLIFVSFPVVNVFYSGYYLPFLFLHSLLPSFSPVSATGVKERWL